MNMHYTRFPFPPPYYLPLYPIDYSMHSDGALIDVMVDVEWTMSPPAFYRRKPMRETHNKHSDGANAVRGASQSSESTSLRRGAPYVSHYGELAPSPFYYIPHTGSSDVCLRVLLLFSPVAEELLSCIA